LLAAGNLRKGRKKFNLKPPLSNIHHYPVFYKVGKDQEKSLTYVPSYSILPFEGYKIAQGTYRGYNMLSIFTDKTSLILRSMLKEPTRSWIIRDFSTPSSKFPFVGHGRVQRVFNEMEKLGYVERKKQGPKSSTILANKEKLISDWTKVYRFNFNEVHLFYSPEKNILKKIKKYFLDKKYLYALTLHTGANLITSFVRTEDIYLYIDKKIFKKNFLDIRQKLDLKQLVKGGNIHIILPYYKNSVFYNLQKIKGYNVVSNLQLYLDLYNFQPRGREHAEYLIKILKEKDKNLE
jgi:hypothetical protein